ncbi:MAG: CoB--CoM heterodisulfide reductase iron-sulfur subunit A family protein [Deltaproteobacteria bacterium]|nr:MAG: CoB--CoM heterodisulfide reductase iron-sulfur subunit A family protein [Deltaproteobacteria bacterium]
MTEEKKETQGTQEEPKVGVYVCHCGGNISDHVDVEVVRQEAEKIPGVVVAKRNMFMCSDPGQDLIAEDIKKGIVNRVVVASCAPSLHETTFRGTLARAGLNPYLYEHANIREQVSWVHDGEPATKKAIRLVAAAVGKAKNLEPLEPIRVDARRHAVVIGGGIAGMRAAKDLSDRGIAVAVIEKSPFLGGHTAELDTVAPTGDRAEDLVMALASDILNDPNISVHTCSEVIGFEGYVGNFTVQVKTSANISEDSKEKLRRMEASGRMPGTFVPFVGVLPHPTPEKDEEFSLNTSVIVLATGFRPYEPRKGEYGYGDHKEVLTLPQFIEKMASAEGSGEVLKIDGKEIRSISMIHCVGSRQIPGIHEPDEDGNLNEYCSRTCCSATLHAANLIRKNFPKTRVFEFYRDIRAYGRGQEELYNEAADNKVIFLRFEPEEPPEVTNEGVPSGYPLKVKVKDTLTFGEEIEVPSDLVVLAVGMIPNDVSTLVEMMKLPVGADKFLLEVHPKLRPVELSIAGILLAGTCQAPMDIGEACNAAGAAAVKASAMLARGYVELDPFVAEVDLEKCKGTGACVEACLVEGALKLVEMEIDGQKVQRAQVVPALCKGCGACVAVCPENAINVKGWTLKQYEEMVDMIVRDELAA